MSATLAASGLEAAPFFKQRCCASRAVPGSESFSPACALPHLADRQRWRASVSSASTLSDQGGNHVSWQPAKARFGNQLVCQLPGSHQSISQTLQKLHPVSRKGKQRGGGGVRAAINIDRRRHLEEAFKRQLEVEAQAEEDSGACPVDCVTPVRNLAEFQAVLDKAEANDDLVVVDFYNTACGSCKYILPQFVKMCKSGGQGAEGMGGVVFVKHDVRDEYDELTDLARFYRIRMVPMFAFFQDGSRKEQFPTRDKRRVEATIKALLDRRRTFDETHKDLSERETTNEDHDEL